MVNQGKFSHKYTRTLKTNRSWMFLVTNNATMASAAYISMLTVWRVLSKSVALRNFPTKMSHLNTKRSIIKLINWIRLTAKLITFHNAIRVHIILIILNKECILLRLKATASTAVDTDVWSQYIKFFDSPICVNVLMKTGRFSSQRTNWRHNKQHSGDQVLQTIAKRYRSSSSILHRRPGEEVGGAGVRCHTNVEYSQHAFIIYSTEIQATVCSEASCRSYAVWCQFE
jgi:hypothetical protein